MKDLFAVSFHFSEYKRATQPSDTSAAEVAAATLMEHSWRRVP